MKIKKDFLKKEERKRVHNLSDFQTNMTDYMNKVITVQHYHEPYKWNFYIQYLDEAKKKRIIWYPYNFAKNGK